MDMSKIFLKDACPTPVGGQAILEGVMMRGMERTAIAVRIPDGRIHIKTRKNGNASKWMKVPIVRGVFSFITSLVEGTKTLTYSADVLEYYDRKLKDDKADGESEKMGKIESLLSERLSSQKLWNLMLAVSVIFALVFSVGIFVLLPTAAVGWIKAYVSSPILLNLTEGILRIVMFLLYLSAISKMEDIKRVFQYHGAEHKTIHCFENNLELTPENAQTFYTLHPRCGTSFLMFVMIISLILFSLLGWPNLLWRLVSRIILIPVVAGTSYELLKWAGRSDNIVVRILSLPGLSLQKITTNEPHEKQLEVAIASLKAVMVDPETPCIEGIIDEDMNLTEEIKISEAKQEKMND